MTVSATTAKECGVKLGNIELITGITAMVLLAGTCSPVNKDDPADVPVVTDTLEEPFGTVRITLDGSGSTASFLGRINNGPTPPNIIWEEVDAAGDCRLYKCVIPFCDGGCGSAGACVADDSCRPYPQGIDAGTMTVTGLKTTDGETGFSLEPLLDNYQLIGVTLQFPPADEGATVTISATGGEDVPAFAMSVKAIRPLVLLNDSITWESGQDIDLRWESATDPSQSTIHYVVDMAYHGGNIGKIEGTCPDNGAFTIPATLLDQLQSFGVFGFPKIEVTRRATGVNASVKTKVIMESKVIVLFGISGYYSCEEDGHCPDGMTCGEGFLCE